jgi:hypothetical protein
MEPLTASIVVILGKYALDKGVELGKEVGPKALEKAKEMFSTVFDHLRKDPKGELVAEGFKEDPATYEKPVEKVLAKEMEADPKFAAQLQALLDQYEQAAKEYAESSGRVYQVTVKGSGAVAMDHGVAAGAGGVAVGRDLNVGPTLQALFKPGLAVCLLLQLLALLNLLCNDDSFYRMMVMLCCPPAFGIPSLLGLFFGLQSKDKALVRLSIVTGVASILPWLYTLGEIIIWAISALPEELGL